LLALCVLIWSALGVLGIDMTLAHLQHFHKIPGDCHDDALYAYSAGLVLGPVQTIVAFFGDNYGEHGMQFRCGDDPK
jgi:hypothetical protein